MCAGKTVSVRIKVRACNRRTWQRCPAQTSPCQPHAVPMANSRSVTRQPGSRGSHVCILCNASYTCYNPYTDRASCSPTARATCNLHVTRVAGMGHDDSAAVATFPCGARPCQPCQSPPKQHLVSAQPSFENLHLGAQDPGPRMTSKCAGNRRRPIRPCITARPKAADAATHGAGATHGQHALAAAHARRPRRACAQRSIHAHRLPRYRVPHRPRARWSEREQA